MRRKRESRDKRRKNEDAVIISRGKEDGAMTELLICLTGSIERRRLNESGNFQPSVNAVIQSRQRVGIHVSLTLSNMTNIYWIGTASLTSLLYGICIIIVPPKMMTLHERLMFMGSVPGEEDDLWYHHV